ncbi:MAG: hypothetical protein JWP26_3254 [Devosia sp.]|uniref:hypothetical protein n=1 Tax=Devosia sp. TaxID=1871048 RepID=UPI0026121ED1|nr:hypothetical protein [Devosia sp.]MDB5588284.1 hypothetical protein [Devosia sp.]
MSAVRLWRRTIASIRQDQSASVSERLRQFFGAAVIIGVAALAAGCVSRPVGDFGRADPSFSHDVMMPTIGNSLAKGHHEPVSNFNQTDQEKEMHNRVWRFLVAPHAKDWFYDVAVELQRTRITGETDLRFAIDRYYTWLKRADYGSSRTRYSTVGRHIQADIDTIPTTFISICQVQEVDRQRGVAEDGLSGLEPDVRRDVAARRAENDMHINWFVRALDYRYQSYDYALNHLLVETPHEQSLAVDDALGQMKVYLDRATRGDFCSGQGLIIGSQQAEIPSRYGSRNYGVEHVDLK